jgi:hypothetical protein
LVTFLVGQSIDDYPSIVHPSAWSVVQIDNMTKAREAKLKKRPKKTIPGIKGAWLLERKQKQPSGNF